MSNYLWGHGHGLLLGDLAPFIVDPACPAGVQAAQRDIGADGSVHETGLFCVLEWAVIDGVDDLRVLLSQLNLESNLRAPLTMTLPDFERYDYVYNVWALRPRAINYRLFPTGLSVMLNNILRIS